MSFPKTTPAGYHTEDEVLYLEANGDGRWVRGGVKDLNVDATHINRENFTGNLALMGRRFAKDRIRITGTINPTTVADIRLSALGAAHAQIGWNTKNKGKYKMNMEFGNTSLGNGAAEETKSVTNSGILLNYTLPSYRVRPNNHAFFNAVIDRTAASWIKYKWMLVAKQNDSGNVVQTRGEIDMNLDITSIAEIQLNWDGGARVNNASLHAQWW